MTPHLGCFELAGQWLGATCRMTVLYRRPKLAWLEPLLDARARAPWTGEVAAPTWPAFAGSSSHSGNGETVGILPDQVPGAGEGDWAEFFGAAGVHDDPRDATCTRASGAALVLAIARRLPRGARLSSRGVPAARSAARGERGASAQSRRRVARPAVSRPISLVVQPLSRCPAGVAPPPPPTAARMGARVAAHRMITCALLALAWLLHWLPQGVLARLGTCVRVDRVSTRFRAGGRSCRSISRAAFPSWTRARARRACARALPSPRPRVARGHDHLVGVARAHPAAGAASKAKRSCARSRRDPAGKSSCWRRISSAWNSPARVSRSSVDGADVLQPPVKPGVRSIHRRPAATLPADPR